MKQDGKDQDGYFKTKAREIANENNISEVISDIITNFSIE